MVSTGVRFFRRAIWVAAGEKPLRTKVTTMRGNYNIKTTFGPQELCEIMGTDDPEKAATKLDTFVEHLGMNIVVGYNSNEYYHVVEYQED